ncbi:hypothetical protein PENSPDRAFT_648826 [Peniophora sp. CONT]|nr:hypothetical protein PENSPDRAFT_648826 [Peniophora sp. CONT]
MTGSYSALDPQKSGYGGSPTWPSEELSFDSGTAYPSSDGEKYDVTNTEERAPRSLLPLEKLVGLPMALHIGVLVLYVALCFVWIAGLERNIQVPFTSASRVQTWLNLISHLIMLAFSTAIVAVMQPITTRSPFGNLPQHLTSISDKISSWNGLGSSLLNLYHNLSFPVTLSNAILTTIYFCTLSGLGISSSFLFNVPAVNETIIRNNMATQIGSPSRSGFIPPGMNLSGIPPTFTNLTFDWFRSGVGVGMLLGNNATFYPGLSANRIYDTLSVPVSSSSNPTAVVNYTDFHVKCGSVPGVSMSAQSTSFYTDTIIVQNSSGVYGIDDLRSAVLLTIDHTSSPSSLTLYDVLSIGNDAGSNMSISRLWQPADVLIRVPNNNSLSSVGRNLILYNIYNETGRVSGSQAILDAENSPGSPWSFEIAMFPDTNYAYNISTSLMVQVIGCSLTTSTGSAQIDATTNRLLDVPPLSQGASAHSIWGDWQPDLNTSNTLEDAWAAMFLRSRSVGLWSDEPAVEPNPVKWPSIDFRYQWLLGWYGGSNGTFTREQLDDVWEKCHIPTVIEDYLTTRLFGAVTAHDEYGDTTRDPSFSNATLGALESALASATAMAMWSAARASTLMVTYHSVVTEQMATNTSAMVQDLLTIVAPVTGSTSVIEHTPVGQIILNVPSLLVGTMLSAILLALCMYILAQGDASRLENTPISDAGLLSIMSLDNSVIAARLSASSMDNVKARRRAGAFLVEIVDGRLVPVEEAD